MGEQPLQTAEIFDDKNALVGAVLILWSVLFSAADSGEINADETDLFFQQLFDQFIGQLRMV